MFGFARNLSRRSSFASQVVDSRAWWWCVDWPPVMQSSSVLRCSLSTCVMWSQLSLPTTRWSWTGIAYLHVTDGIPLSLQRANRSVNGAAACATFCVAYSILASLQDATLEPAVPASQDGLHSQLRRTVPKIELPMSRAYQVDKACSIWICITDNSVSNQFAGYLLVMIA